MAGGDSTGSCTDGLEEEESTGDIGDATTIFAGDAREAVCVGSSGCTALPRRACATTCPTAVRAFIDASLTWNAFAKNACTGSAMKSIRVRSQAVHAAEPRQCSGLHTHHDAGKADDR